MKLADGLTCTMRAGGTGPQTRVRPSWVVFYYCNNGYATWGPTSSESSPVTYLLRNSVWTVHVGHDSDNTRIWKVNVKRAWFVGTLR